MFAPILLVAFCGGLRAVLVMVEQIERLWNSFPFIHLGVLVVRLPRAMRRFMMRHQEKRFVLLAALEVLDRMVGDDVGAVSLELLLLTHFDHGGVVINALAGQHDPVIEAARIVLQVPLADEACLVAGALQQLGDVLTRRIEAIGQRLDACNMTVLPRHDDAAARRANRVRAEAVVEAHARFRDAVDVRRLIDAAAIRADGVRVVIVRHDVEKCSDARR